jgi:hypothetical protein
MITLLFFLLQAEALLYTKPDGTFIIRQSSNGQYALSIVHSGGRIGHCLIFRYLTSSDKMVFLVRVDPVPVGSGNFLGPSRIRTLNRIRPF